MWAIDDKYKKNCAKHSSNMCVATFAIFTNEKAVQQL